MSKRTCQSEQRPGDVPWAVLRRDRLAWRSRIWCSIQNRDMTGGRWASDLMLLCLLYYIANAGWFLWLSARNTAYRALLRTDAMSTVFLHRLPNYQAAIDL